MPTAIAVKVIDASALVALLFEEPEAAVVASRIEESELIAPALIAFELTNVCLKRIRRNPSQRDKLLAAYFQADRLEIEHRVVDHAGVLDLAEATGLTAYDASYLWLARALSAELVTLDGQLAQAATTLVR